MMENRLSHLPQAKQQMIERMLDTILRVFQEQFAPKRGRSIKDTHIVKVILYGSHARGGYVNDFVSGYHSDYDFCILVNNARFKDFKYWHGVEAALKDIPFPSDKDHSRASLIVHSYREMNARLKDGWPFYADIVRDGMTLYTLDGYDLAPIGPMKKDRRHEMADKWFHQEMEEAEKFLQVFTLVRAQGDRFQNIAAFNLHQATESLYRCLLMTLQLYAPKLHDLKALHQRAVELVPELKDVWPVHDRVAERAFGRLRDAYVKARYSPKYEITNEELDWLESRIVVLRQMVEEACKTALQENN